MYRHIDPLVAKFHAFLFENLSKPVVAAKHMCCRKRATLINHPMRGNAQIGIHCFHRTAYEPRRSLHAERLADRSIACHLPFWDLADDLIDALVKARSLLFGLNIEKVR